MEAVSTCESRLAGMEGLIGKTKEMIETGTDTEGMTSGCDAMVDAVSRQRAS